MHIIRTIAVTASALALLGGVGGIAGCQSPESQDLAPINKAASQVERARTDSFAAKDVVAETPRAPAPLEIRSDSSKLASQVQALQAEQRRLTKGYQALAQRLSALETKHDASRAVPNEGSSVSTTESEEAQRQAYEAQEQAQIARLEAAAARQASDPQWSGAATEQIAAAVNQALKGPGQATGERVNLVSSNCGTILCRLELASADPATLSSFIDEFSLNLGWNASAHMHHTTNPDGSLTTVVYLLHHG